MAREQAHVFVPQHAQSSRAGTLLAEGAMCGMVRQQANAADAS